MQVLTNFCVFIIFVGQGAKIFIVYNRVSDTRDAFPATFIFPNFFLSQSTWKRGIDILLYLNKASSVTAGIQ